MDTPIRAQIPAYSAAPRVTSWTWTTAAAPNYWCRCALRPPARVRLPPQMVGRRSGDLGQHRHHAQRHALQPRLRPDAEPDQTRGRRAVRLTMNPPNQELADLLDRDKIRGCSRGWPAARTAATPNSSPRRTGRKPSSITASSPGHWSTTWPGSSPAPRYPGHTACAGAERHRPLLRHRVGGNPRAGLPPCFRSKKGIATPSSAAAIWTGWTRLTTSGGSRGAPWSTTGSRILAYPSTGQRTDGHAVRRHPPRGTRCG